MLRLKHIAVLVFVLAGLTAPANADKPAEPAEPKTYTVSCKLVRKVLRDSAERKRELETIESRIPDLTALEGTRAEYPSGGKVGATPYGFQLRTEVTAAPKNTVRLEVRAQESSTEGSGVSPLIQTHRQRVVRHVRLGQPIKLELAINKQGEGVWVELTVREV